MKTKNKKNTNTKFIIGMMIWPICHFLFFTIFINAMTLVMSFYRYSVTGDQLWYGLGNYTYIIQSIFSGGSIGVSLLNSLSFLPLNLFIMVPLPVFFAYFMYKKIWGYKVFRVIYFLPSIICIVVLIMAFKYMFDDTFGLVTLLFKSLGLESWIPDGGFFGTHISSYAMLWLYTVWGGLGHQLVIIQGSMLRIPKSVIESGKLDGVGIWREFFKIVIPLIFGNIATLILFACMGVFNIFIQPQLMFGNSTEKATIALLVVNQSKGNENAQVGAAALGMMITIVASPLMIALRKFLNKITPDVEY